MSRDYITCWAKVWQPGTEDPDVYNQSNVTISVVDFERWIRGDKGSCVLTVEDGKWLAVRLDSIIELSEADYQN